MTADGPYDIALSPASRRSLAEDLPEQVAAAIIEFLTGSLIDAPRTVGKPLVGQLSGVWSVRRGAYRVLYRIDETERTMLVVRIDHRRDAYRQSLTLRGWGSNAIASELTPSPAR